MMRDTSSCTSDNVCEQSACLVVEGAKCPENPLVLLAAIVCGFFSIGVVFYVLHTKDINTAILSIGVDYFQIVALFSRARIEWPSDKKAFIFKNTGGNWGTTKECRTIGKRADGVEEIGLKQIDVETIGLGGLSQTKRGNRLLNMDTGILRVGCGNNEDILRSILGVPNFILPVLQVLHTEASANDVRPCGHMVHDISSIPG